jgi:hypothetical protein
MVIGRDLNLVMEDMEVWRLNIRCDPLTTYVYSLFLDFGLVDIDPLPLALTCRNG